MALEAGDPSCVAFGKSCPLLEPQVFQPQKYAILVLRTSGSLHLNPGSVTLGRFLELSVPQFPHLQRGDNKCICLVIASIKRAHIYKAFRTILGQHISTPK